MSGPQGCLKLEFAPSAKVHIGTEKKCIKCGLSRLVNEFNFRKNTKDGRYYYCRECAKEMNCLWCKKNPEKKRESDKRWAIAHPEKIRQKLYLWAKANPERIANLRRKAHRKYQNSPKGNLNNRISANIRSSLKGDKGGRSWPTLVGFTIDQLKKHLEKNFLLGMSWENRKEWHIDHKIPLSVFNFEKPEDIDFKRAWNLKNLQPLWGQDNRSKYNKINKFFQPNLIFQ